MKIKRFISMLLVLTMVFATMQAMCGFAANALVYNSSVLNYYINNAPTYREDLYTQETYLNYVAVLEAAKTVNSNTSATADEINAAVADLAAAEAALTKAGASYHSALNLRVPNAISLAAGDVIKFKDALSKEVTNITVTAEYANVGSFQLGEDGFYTAPVTATGATGSTATVTVTYDCNGETYTFNVHFMVVTEGQSTANKAALGAKLAYEYALNRQESDYSSGFVTYQNVIKASAENYINSTTTQTKVDRAVENITMAVGSLVNAYADYSEIYTLVAQANELDPDNYDSFTAVTQALDLIVYDYPASQQSVVDAMAEKLRTALDGLTLKVSRYTVNCVTYTTTVADDGTQTNVETLLGSTTYDGTRTYVVRVTAPVYPGYEATEQYQTIELTEDDQTVTFVYEPVTYYAYFNANGGSVDVDSIELTYDKEYGTLPVATRDGYAFLGWFSDPVAGEQVYSETMVTVNYVSQLYAHWSDVEVYTFNFDAGLGTACDSITAEYGTEIDMPVPYLFGHTFVGWFYEDGTAASYETMPDIGDDGAVVTLTAQYTKAVYDVVLDAGENGTVSDASYTVTFGNTYGDIPAAVREGYTFVGWFTQAQGGTQVTSSTVVELESVHTLYAQYTVNTYTLAFNMDGGDEITSITAEYGTPIVLPTQPNKQYYLFAGWTLDGEAFELSTMPAAAEVGGTTTITAVWTLNTLVDVYLEAYKTVNGVRVPAMNIQAGDSIEVEVSLKTNFGLGQSIFGILFDKRVFALQGTTVPRTATVNTESEYIGTLRTKTLSGAVNYSSSNWAKYFEDDENTPDINEADPIINATDFQCIRVQTAAFNTAKEPVVLTEKTLIFTLNLDVLTEIDASLTSGIVTMDERMACSYINNNASYTTRFTNQTENDYINIIPNFDNARVEVEIKEDAPMLGATDGSTTVVNYSEGLVYGLAEELTLDKFKSDYATVIGTGTIECDDSVLKTGSVIRIMSGTDCVAQYTVVIYGDLDSDGDADAEDAYKVKLIVAGFVSADSLTKAQQYAADPNHDGVIDAADAELLENASLLKEVVSQTP